MFDNWKEVLSNAIVQGIGMFVGILVVAALLITTAPVFADDTVDTVPVEQAADPSFVEKAEAWFKSKFRSDVPEVPATEAEVEESTDDTTDVKKQLTHS